MARLLSIGQNARGTFLSNNRLFMVGIHGRNFASSRTHEGRQTQSTTNRHEQGKRSVLAFFDIFVYMQLYRSAVGRMNAERQ